MAHPGWRRPLLAFVVLAIAASSLLPGSAVSATPGTAALPLQLNLDGGAPLQPSALRIPASTLPVTVSPISLIPDAQSAGGGASITLGAPSAAATTLGCNIFIVCTVLRLDKDVYVGGISCAASDVGITLFIFSTHTCLADAHDLVSTVSSWALGSSVSDLLGQLNQEMSNAAAGVSTSILVKELGTRNSFNSPVLSCKEQSNAAASCNDNWFLTQLAVIRSLAMYFIIPLIMLVVIQSVVKGSLYFLLRAVLIMLPVAVIGSVLIVALAQILMNIADDMAAAVSNYTVSVAGYGNSVSKAIQGLNAKSFGLFTWLWMLVFVLAALAIFIELILREVGVYLSVLFLPLAFAALVWPSASKYARRLTELLIGLIFSKVFIIGAFSLGLAAFAHVGVAAPAGADGTTSQTDAVTSSIMTGSVTMLMAAFAGGKLLELTPAAMGAAEGYVLNRSRVTSKGNAAVARAGKYSATRQQQLRQIQPQGPFVNVGPPTPPPPRPRPRAGP